MDKIFIGVSWPYADGPLHVGQVASSYLPPDIFARYHRMKGSQVLMVSGSDMHGTPITVTADKEGVEPENIAKRYHDINSDCMKNLGITFDLFFYTAHDNHKTVVHELFLRLHERGYIYEKSTLSPYCSQCKRFLPDRYVIGTCPYCSFSDARGDQCDECGKTLDPDELKNPRCRICSATPEMKEGKHLFFKLSAFETRLLDYIKDKAHWKNNTLKFTKNWLESGLIDRAITRDIPWGIEVPLGGFEDKKIYVWFEAVMGYLSASKEWARLKGDKELWESFWKDNNSRHYYFIGKDNIPFHTIIWPAMLMGVDFGLNLPYDVPANEYVRLGKEKFSKSRGVLVDVPSLLDKYDPDALRYYLAVNMPEHRDVEFSWDEFYRKNNGELVATYGNLANRVLSFAEKHFGSVPAAKELENVDMEFLEKARELIEHASQGIEKCSFQAGIRNVMAIAALGNKYLDDKAPWKQIKEDKDACATTINTALIAVKALAIVTAPFLPFSAQRLWNMLGYEDNVHKQRWTEALSEISPGQKFRGIKPLFKKLEPVKEPSAEAPSKHEEITRKLPLELRVGEVIEVRNHPQADKLYILEVALGEERGTLVAGLKPYYKPEELEGKKIPVLCNLQPAKIRGVESKGMLLAADDGTDVGVLIVEEGKPGDLILGREDAPEISISEFQDFRLEVAELDEFKGVKGAALILEGEKIILKVNQKPIRVDKDLKAGAKIR